MTPTARDGMSALAGGSVVPRGSVRTRVSVSLSFADNPDEVAQLELRGVEVAGRVPTRLHLTEADARYLTVQRDHTAHTLDLLLPRPTPENP